MSEIGRLLGAGKEAEVYEHGTLALKLYRPGRPKAPAFREAANLADRRAALAARTEGPRRRRLSRPLGPLDGSRAGLKPCR